MKSNKAKSFDSKPTKEYVTGYNFMSDQALNAWKRIGGYEAGYQDGLADSSAALWSLFTALTLSMLL